MLLLINSVIVGTCILVAVQFYDITYDGQWYHSEAILALKNGWNPFRGYYYSPYPHSQNYPLWVNHYPNGSGFVKATVFALTGRIESGKFINLLLLPGSAIIVYGTLRLFHRTSGIVNILVSFLLAANPIALGELFSNYVDGQMYAYILIISSLLVRCIHQPKYIWPALVATIYLVNLKYTGLIYIFIFFFGFLLYLLLRKQFLRAFKYAVWIGVTCILATCFFGYPTYVKNYTHKGHPMYPLMGKDKKDIAKILYPADFFDKNRFEKFVLSNFGQPGHTRAPSYSVQRKPFIDFNLHYTEDYKTMVSETSGFGPANPEIFFVWLLCIPLLFIAAYRYVYPRWLLYILGVVLLSVFLNPDAWLARYAPQFYICLPLVALGLLVDTKTPLRIVGWILVLVLILNTGIIGYYYIPSQVKYSREINTTLEKLRHTRQVRVFFSFIVSHRQRLAESGVEFTEADGYLQETFTAFPYMLNATYYSVESDSVK